MRTLANILLVFLLASCQKEIPLYADKDPKTGQTPTPVQEPEPQPGEPKDTIYRAEPDQEIIMSDFAPMLWEKSRYRITEYYCVKRNLWDELPAWLKDDTYTFHESGKIWVIAGAVQHPTDSFNIKQGTAHLYAEVDGIKLKMLDENYNPKVYSVVAYKAEESFTLSSLANDSSKVFYTFSYLGKE